VGYLNRGQGTADVRQELFVVPCHVPTARYQKVAQAPEPRSNFLVEKNMSKTSHSVPVSIDDSELEKIAGGRGPSDSAREQGVLYVLNSGISLPNSYYDIDPKWVRETFGERLKDIGITGRYATQVVCEAWNRQHPGADNAF
jgi:hypothetical protein